MTNAANTNTVLPANDNRTAYAVVVNPFSDRPLFWTGSILTADVEDCGGFDLDACERAAASFRKAVTPGGGWGEINGERCDWPARATYDAAVVIEVKADRWGNIQA